MDNLPIVIGVIVVVALLAYVLFFRKKALPEPSETTPEETERPKPTPAAKKPIEERPREKTPPPAPAAKVAEVPSLPSPQVEEEPEPAEPSAAAPPPVVSKKDVAGLRKGLAATRG